MITEYLLLLILILLAEILKRMKAQRPLAPAGGGMLPPWQACELLRLETQSKNARGWG